LNELNNNFNQSASQGNINFGIAKSPQQIAKIENISTLSNQIKNEISIKAFAGDYNENMMNNETISRESSTDTIDFDVLRSKNIKKDRRL